MKNKVMKFLVMSTPFVLGFWATVGDKISQFGEWLYGITGGAGVGVH